MITQRNSLVCRNREKLRELKCLLDGFGLFEKKLGIHEADGVWYLPLNGDIDENVSCFDVLQNYEFALHDYELRDKANSSPLTKISALLEKTYGTALAEDIMREIPRKFEHYDNFIMLPEDSFTSDFWKGKDQIILKVCDIIRQCVVGSKDYCETFMARKQRIPNGDILRRPAIEWFIAPPKRNEDDIFWTSTTQNGLKYVWAPEHTMFSRGNITEKTRIFRRQYPKRDLGRKEVVLDLYAGIGYFALAYWMSGSVSEIYACEWNEFSVKGLKRGIEANKIPKDKFHVFSGNNEQHLNVYRRKADRVNLGLLPDAGQGYPLAVEALIETGGFMHIHVNIMEGEEEEWKKDLTMKLKCLFLRKRFACWNVVVRHIERVKSFSPRVWHYVYDVECFPSEI